MEQQQQTMQEILKATTTLCQLTVERERIMQSVLSFQLALMQQPRPSMEPRSPMRDRVLQTLQQAQAYDARSALPKRQVVLKTSGLSEVSHDDDAAVYCALYALAQEGVVKAQFYPGEPTLYWLTRRPDEAIQKQSVASVTRETVEAILRVHCNGKENAMGLLQLSVLFMESAISLSWNMLHALAQDPTSKVSCTFGYQYYWSD